MKKLKPLDELLIEAGYVKIKHEWVFTLQRRITPMMYDDLSRGHYKDVCDFLGIPYKR